MTLSDVFEIEEVIIAPRSPWQNAFVERLVETLRRECLEHMIIQSEAHLRRTLRDFLRYSLESRCHQALQGEVLNGRGVESPERGCVVAEPMVGGLPHRYRRAG